MVQPRSIRRIAFITTGYPTDDRPYECIFIHRSIKALVDQIVPLVIHLRAWRPGRKIVERRVWDGVNVISLSCPQLPMGSYSHFNTYLLEKFGFPLIKEELDQSDIIHGADAYPSGYVAGMWALKSHKPCSFTVAGSDIHLFLKKNSSHLNRGWLTNLKGVTCNSDDLRQELIELLGVLPNTQTLYRGVDTVAFSSPGEKLGPQADLPPVRFLYLGGLHSLDPDHSLFNLKGGSTMLEAWSMIDDYGLPASLVFGGPGKYNQKLETWKSSLKHPDNFYCVNTVDPSQMPGYLRAADVIIIPSLQEGLPNLLREAQSCARPVISTRVGGIPEALIDGQTGWLIPPADPVALAARIRWFCENQDQIKAMGEKGRERMQNRFSWEQYEQQMLSFFDSIAEQGEG